MTYIHGVVPVFGLRLTVATEGIPSIGQVRVLDGGALLLLQGLSLCRRTAWHVGGAEPLLRLLWRGAQRLPRDLGRERRQEQESMNASTGETHE